MIITQIRVGTGVCMHVFLQLNLHGDWLPCVSIKMFLHEISNISIDITEPTH